MYGEEWEREVLSKLDEAEKEIYYDLKEYAEKNHYKLNPNKSVVVGIIKGLRRNEIRYGARYCPCRQVSGNPIEDMKIICPCVYHRDEIERDGHCKCRIFVRGD